MYHLDLDYVQEFIVLADSMSFVRAAERLFISQSALTRHMSALEAQLGVRLIERSTRTVYLTEAGLAIYRDSLKLMEAVRATCERADYFASGYSGRLRVSVPAWTMKYLDPVILEFYRRRPGVRIELHLVDIYEGQKQLLWGKTDICIAAQSDRFSDGLELQKLADEPLCALLSANHPLAARSAVSVQDLRGERFVVYQAVDPDADAEARSPAKARPSGKTPGSVQFLYDHRIDPERFLYLDNPDMLALTIRQENAVCVMLKSLGDLGKDYLVSVPLSGEDAVLPIWLCRREDNAGEEGKDFFSLVRVLQESEKPAEKGRADT